MSSLLKVTEIEGRGRSLIATEPLKAGQVILTDSPILLYSALPISSNSTKTTSYCDTCYRFIPTPSFSCCNYHVFCANNPNCPRGTTQSNTNFVCQALTNLGNYNWAPLNNSLERQTQARFLIAAYNLFLLSPPKFNQLLALQGKETDSDDPIAKLLYSIVSPLCQGLTIELTAALLAKDSMNAFGLMEPFKEGEERSVRAYGIYPNASYFNHDCLPNACRFDYVDSSVENNTDIVVRMIHDVPLGREICLSYFPVNDSYSTRQKRLREDYKFVCNCDRCKVEANWSDNEDDDNDATMEESEGEGEDDGNMEDDVEDHMGNEGDNGNEDESDFPHAYFFVKYMCSRENCGGTLAPLPPPDATVMECNVCGDFKRDEEFGA
ncbi:hypothetical protein ACFE04_024491 [Oxalis oulophora]